MSATATATHGETGVQGTLDRWREQGDDRLDPVRFHFIEALARRAAAHRGEARRLLDARLMQLVEAYAADLANAASNARDATCVVPPTESARSALAGLSDYVAARHEPHGKGDDAAARRAVYPEVETLDYFRDVWARLRTQKQLRQSLEQVPGNAGPLNSSSLVHRSLSLMRELSPGYLGQFLSYMETLSWVEQMTSGGVSVDKDAPQTTNGRTKKNARGKAR